MNKYDEALMDKPSIKSLLCPFCGRRATNAHHIVYRSRGGHYGPTVDCCGSGTTGCHDKIHRHLINLRWSDEIGWWEFLETSEGISQQQALEEIKEGWKRVEVYEEGFLF